MPRKAAVSASEEVKKETAVGETVNTEAGTQDAEKTEAAPAKKTPVKRTRRAASKKTAQAKDSESGMYIQYGGWQISTAVIEERIKEAYKAEGHRVSSIKSLQIYVKPEEALAYYVINGKPEGKKISLL